MLIKKVVQSKILRDYFFIEGQLDVDTDYFIEKINLGIKEKDNQNFKTNVVGGMTSYSFFTKDKVFVKTILPLIDFIDDNLDLKEYFLKDAWGVKNTFGCYTKNHDHGQAYISGSVFLNRSEQGLYFGDIKKTIKSEPGNFVLFSSFLKHKTTKRVDNFDETKYAIAFNWFTK